MDPKTDDQETQSTYQYSWNNPANKSDANGDCPWCIAALKGAVQEYGTQVIGNLASGKSLKESLTQVDVKEIAIAAVTDGLTLGLGSLTKVSKVAKIVDKIADRADDVRDANKALNKVESAKGGVYVLKDADGIVKRSGRTVDLAARKAQHKVGDKTKDLTFEVAHKTDNYAEQRGLEHLIYKKHEGTATLNKIKAISDKNLKSDKGQSYINAAQEYLKKQ